MTMRELVKKLFGTDNLDEEVKLETDEETKQPADGKNEDPAKLNDDNVETTKKQQETKHDKAKENVETKEEEVDSMNIFELGWYDEKTGKIDLNKIKNDEVRGVIDTLTKQHAQAIQARDIQDAITSELSQYSLNVSTDTLRKMLDTSAVKVGEDGKISGIKDAIEAVKKSEPGLFKDKAKESNPLNEGFSPVERKVTGIDGMNSLMDALVADSASE